MEFLWSSAVIIVMPATWAQALKSNSGWLNGRRRRRSRPVPPRVSLLLEGC